MLETMSIKTCLLFELTFLFLYVRFSDTVEGGLKDINKVPNVFVGIVQRSRSYSHHVAPENVFITIFMLSFIFVYLTSQMTPALWMVSCTASRSVVNIRESWQPL